MTRIGFVKHAILTGTRSRAGLALFVVLSVAVPTLVRFGFEPLLQGRIPYLTYFPAVMLAGILVDWPAAAIVALGSLITNDLLFRPAASFTANEALARELLFLLVSATLIFLGQALRRTVTELDAAARREAFLAAELGHRSKNNLALIGAIARRCLRPDESAEDFLERLLPRIQALAQAQDLLTRRDCEPCELRTLVEDALKPFADHGGISVEGPETPISAAECTPLVMAVHELATNASKYGALSVPEGRVAVSWDGAGRDGVTIVWQESNGPRVEPPVRRGLGSRLIDRHPAFRAVSLEFPPDGARCSIALKPAAARS